MMFLSDFNKEDKIYIIIILLFSCLTAYNLIQYYTISGLMNPDTALYLIDSLKFAGLDEYNICLSSDIFYSPVICFLTSILFRLGLVDKLAIFIVTAIFGILGEIGLYVLFRFRFNQLLSLTGTIIFACLSQVLWNFAGGYIDIPSVSISIWIIIFTLVALGKNPKFFILIFPLGVIGFFTRYTVGFILPVIMIYYILSKDIVPQFVNVFNNKKLFREKLFNYFKSDEFKYILLSLVFGIIIFLIISLFILNQGGELTFFNQSINTFNGIKHNVNAVDFNLSRLYYVKNLKDILFSEDRLLDSTIFYGLMFLMIGGSLIRIKQNFHCFKWFNNKLNSKKNITLILNVFFMLSIFGIIYGFVFIKNHMFTNVCLVITIILIYYNIQPENDFNLKFTILNLSWLSICFIFASLYVIKVPRYALPFLVPLVYFIVWGLDGIIIELENFKFIKEKNLMINKLIPLLLLILILFSSCSYILMLPQYGEYQKTGLIDVTEYIVAHDSDYHSKEIVAYDHYYSILKWYLQVNGTKLRFFETDVIDSMNVSYVVINHDYDFKNYHKIYNSKEIYLFAHD